MGEISTLKKNLHVCLFRIEHQLIHVYKRDAVCLLQGTN
jgi:hypothetical protein